MNVRVPAEPRRFVDRTMRSGRFRSQSAAVSAALRLLREEERWLEDARKKVEEGLADLDAGRAVDGPTAMRELLEEIRARGRRDSS